MLHIIIFLFPMQIYSMYIQDKEDNGAEEVKKMCHFYRV